MPVIKYGIFLATISAIFFVGHLLDIHPFCIFKKITGIPCPGCGIQRSIYCLFKGDFHGAFIDYNPIGGFLVICAIISFFCLLVDCVLGTRILYQITHTSSGFNKKTAIILIFTLLITIANWWWNLKKGL